ncbi:MAG: hypothetical protein CMP91_11890 [Gammaproteobacteria bacterium]|nr:hypothetical protein [Gammaproteobacteria bacterium]
MTDPKDLEKLRTEEFIVHDLELVKNQAKWKKYTKVIANAMSSISWIGMFLNAKDAFQGDKKQGDVNDLYEQWFKVHKIKIQHLLGSLDEMAGRLESIPDAFDSRIESDEYLTLVRRAFKSWDDAETIEKRQYVVNLISNAAATNICPDDLIRLYNDWLDQYHEIHFKIIRAIYQNPGITRLGIWQSFSDEIPRDDSAEADLFRKLISDLQLGRVIRNHRPTNYQGQFIKQSTRGKSRNSSGTIESAFENTKQIELTELGSQFVHYTMNEVVKRIENT